MTKPKKDETQITDRQKTRWTTPLLYLSLSGTMLFLVSYASALIQPIDYQLYPSSWPNEHYNGPGSDASPGGGVGTISNLLTKTTRDYSEGFAFLTRDPSELYLIGGLIVFPNYIAKMDPITLKEIKRTSLDCPSTVCPSNYIWAPSGAVHANGNLYVVTESRVWDLDKDLNILAFYDLPLKAAFYNSLKILPDGNIVVKGLGVDGTADAGKASLTVLKPDLTPVVPDYKLPESSAGRLSILTRNNKNYIYVTGTTKLIRLIYTPGGSPAIVQDANWSYQYRNATDPATSAGSVASFFGSQAYFTDNAQTSPSLGPMHLMRVNLDDAADAQKITPFPNSTRAFNLSKQVVDPVNNVIVLSDPTNGRLAGFRYAGSNKFTLLWQKPFKTQVVPAIASGSKQLYVDDLSASLGECVVVLDILTGQELYRIPTGEKKDSFAILSLGYNNDFFFNSGQVNTNLSMRIYRP